MSKIPFKVFLDTLNIISNQTTPPVHQEICDWLENTDISLVPTCVGNCTMTQIGVAC